MREYSIGETRFDAMKWLLIAAIMGFAVVGNYFYANVSLPLRLIVGLGVGAVVLVIAAQTKSGLQFLAFAKQARAELYKVVWPTRQEVVQTTAVVMLMVVAAALLLWCLDALLFWTISFITV